MCSGTPRCHGCIPPGASGSAEPSSVVVELAEKFVASGCPTSVLWGSDPGNKLAKEACSRSLPGDSPDSPTCMLSAPLQSSLAPRWG